MENRSCLIHLVLKVLNQPCGAQSCRAALLWVVGALEAAVCWPHSPFACTHRSHRGNGTAVQQPRWLHGACGNLSQPGVLWCPQQPPLREGHPCRREPSGSSGVAGFSAGALWAGDPGLGKRSYSGLPGFSFPLLLLG